MAVAAVGWRSAQNEHTGEHAPYYIKIISRLYQNYIKDEGIFRPAALLYSLWWILLMDSPDGFSNLKSNQIGPEFLGSIFTEIRKPKSVSNGSPKNEWMSIHKDKLSFIFNKTNMYRSNSWICIKLIQNSSNISSFLYRFMCEAVWFMFIYVLKWSIII